MFASQTKDPPRWSNTSAAATFVDASGYAVFSNDDDGAAHAAAHRMLDQGRLAEGYRWLGRWLDGRQGLGSRWIHLQWHQAVFEVSLGLWEDALARFRGHILPSVSAGEALTDAPALLWRLALARPGATELPWAAVRIAAAENVGTGTAYIELHHLLALAGAGDVPALNDWVRAGTARLFPGAESLLLSWAMGLRAFAARNWAAAAPVLEPAVSGIRRLGGSKAQNQLFADIAHAAHRRSLAERPRSTRSRPLAPRPPRDLPAVSRG